jgi:hypothetical protein
MTAGRQRQSSGREPDALAGAARVVYADNESDAWPLAGDGIASALGRG